MKLDPITLEILNNKIASVADEMYFTLQRSSRSAYVKEGADFGTAILDYDGKVFGYPPSTTVQFLLDIDCRATIRKVKNLEPGDIIVSNDPYMTEGLSTHLPDIHLIMPYFHKGRIIAYGWCFIHATDIGGRVPSSISPSSTEIFQEGLRIPPMKIVKRGKFNDDFVKIFKANCRIPEINMGDIRAMVGSMLIGERRLKDLIEQHGLETILIAEKDLQDYTAEKARQVLRKLPDGEYEFWDYMDDDLVSRYPVRLHGKLIVKDGKVTIDVSGCDPQLKAAYNVPTANGRNYWLTMRITTFMTTHDKTMAMNAGLYRHISVNNPPGTVMNAEFPDPVGVRHATARRLNDAMTGAVLRAAPTMMAAPSCGASCPMVLAEYSGKGGERNVVVVEPMRGGMGALRGQDGVDARDAQMSNMKNHPIEIIEAEAGVLIREYDVCTDSGGPGQWRGGVGQKVSVEILRDGGTILARGMERMRFPAYGVMGGKPAQPFRAFLNRGKPGEKRLAKIDELKVNKGDTVTIMNPGAGGYGDPFLRAPEKVRADVELGFVTRESAARDYGVAIRDDGTLDAEATRALRARRVKDNVHADFDFGPEREAWEAVFDNDTMKAMNRLLYALPKSVRYEKRRWLFSQAIPDMPVAGERPIADVLKDPDAVRARLRQAMRTLEGERAKVAAD